LNPQVLLLKDYKRLYSTIQPFIIRASPPVTHNYSLGGTATLSANWKTNEVATHIMHKGAHITHTPAPHAQRCTTRGTHTPDLHTQGCNKPLTHLYCTRKGMSKLGPSPPGRRLSRCSPRSRRSMDRGREMRVS